MSAAGCGSSAGAAADAKGRIVAVGAENEYANVISQIGGRYVSVTAIESNPNTDPHTFEASPSVAQTVSAARLVVQNGVGYDTFMNKIEAASPSSSRKVIDVQTLLGPARLDPQPAPLVHAEDDAGGREARWSRTSRRSQPSHAAYFAANAQRFDASLKPWYQALEQFAARYPRTPVATTEPVGDYMLQAAGTINMTPFGLQADIMNGVDPAPQDVSLQDGLFSGHRVKVFLYNQQVTDSLTESFLAQAEKYGIPVVGVYETMPVPGYDYQSWMLAEVNALQRAVADGVSTEQAPVSAGTDGRERPGGARGRGGHRPLGGPDGARRGQLLGSRGRVHRPDRLQRRRQDDAVPRDPRPPAARRRARAGRRWRALGRASRLRAAEVPARPGHAAARPGPRRARARRPPARPAAALALRAASAFEEMLDAVDAHALRRRSRRQAVRR